MQNESKALGTKSASQPLKILGIHRRALRADDVAMDS